MRSISITKAKNSFSALIQQVRRGQAVVITDRDRPVARLEPLQAAEPLTPERMQHLARIGLVTLGRRKLRKKFIAQPPPKAKGKATLTSAVLEERDQGR